MFKLEWQETLKPGVSKSVTIADSSMGGQPRVEFAVDDELYHKAMPKKEKEVTDGDLVVDNCEDTSLLGGTWTAGNGATVGITAENKKEGSYSLYIKGASTDNPYAEVSFSSAQDWSEFTMLSIWIAPLDEDQTPALSETCQVRLEDDDGDTMTFSMELSDEADEWRVLQMEMNSSGEGKSGSEGGTFDSTKVKKIRVTISTTENTVDMCFDQITYSLTTEMDDAPLVESWCRRRLLVMVNGQIFVQTGSNPWQRCWNLLRSCMAARIATLYIYPNDQSEPSDAFAYNGKFRGEVKQAKITLTENEQKFDVQIQFAAGRDPALPDEQVS